MSDGVEGIWRLLPAVRPTERSRFAFFFVVSALISLSQTLGLAGSEALFLARFGVEYLPHVFIAASVVTVVGMLLYASLVGSVRNDKLLTHILWIAALVLGGAAFGAARGADLWIAGLLIIYFLTQAVFLNHFWTFASDYFDIMASKRLSHLFTIGASAGGVVGGGIAVGVSRVASPEMLIVGWAVLLVATAGVIRLRRRELLRWASSSWWSGTRHRSRG